MFNNYNSFWNQVPRWLVYFFVTVLFICGMAFYFASIAISSYKHDNLVEEIVEKLIEKTTELDVDLSPESPEPQP
jgi:TRAP-type C4-dicarboxylate transport system permease small subunit